MPYIRTDRTGVGFNTGQTGTETSNGGGGGDPILLADLVAGWALTSNANQTLSSAGVVASGDYDLTNLNGVTFDSDGAHFSASNKGLQKTSAALTLVNVPFLICYTILPGTDNGGEYPAYCVGTDDGTFQLKVEGQLGAGDDFQKYGISGAPANIQLAADSLPRNQRSVVVCGSDQVTIGLKTNVVSKSTVAYDGGPDTSTARLTIGNTWNLDSGASDTLPAIRYVYFWSGANAATIYNNAAWITWLENGGVGRTPAEVAAYTG